MAKTMLVTGAAKRIGREIALYFAKAGYDMAIHCHHSEAEAKSLEQEIVALGRRACIIQADLADEQAVRQIIPQACEALGSLDVLINNASAFASDDIQTVTASSWNDHLDVNCRAPIFLMQDFAKQYQGKSGNVINLLDYCVLHMPDSFLSYVSSKAALWQASKIIAQQVAPHIRVNGIGPSQALKNAKETEERFKEATQATPLQYAAGPQEICEAIAFLLNASSMTGQMLALDGGKHLQGAAFY